MRRVPGSATPGQLSARLFAPGGYDAPSRVAVGWQRATYIAGTPHVNATLHLGDDLLGGEAMLAATATTGEATEASATDVGRCEGLFMLGLGVGGLGVLLGCVHHAVRLSLGENAALGMDIHSPYSTYTP